MAFEIKIQEIDSKEEPDSFLGVSPIIIKYKPPGSRSYQTREAGEEKEQNEIMLRRIFDELMRRAFPETIPTPMKKGTTKTS